MADEPVVLENGGAGEGKRPSLVPSQGGGTSTRRELNFYHRAITECWPITNEHRAAIVDLANEVINARDAPLPKRIMAARLLIHADHVNVRRERTALEEKVNEADVALRALRATLAAGPQLRDALQQLTAQMLSHPGRSFLPQTEAHRPDLQVKRLVDGLAEKALVHRRDRSEGSREQLVRILTEANTFLEEGRLTRRERQQVEQALEEAEGALSV